MTEETKNQTLRPEESEETSSDSNPVDGEELRRLYEESLTDLKEGAIVKGKIIKVSNDEVIVDVGYKSEGIVPLSEFERPEDVEPGKEIDVFLESMEDADGMIVLSKTKAEKQKRWDETILRSNEGDIVTGKITRKVRGGVIVDIGMDAFLPASQIDIRHVSNVEEYIGKMLDFKIIKINTDRKNIVLSRRELLEEERARNREALLAEIEVGQIRDGVVKNITDFGAFIDLYGMDGLLHITDITWGRINHPSELLSVGDKIEVMVLDFDRERQRIALGLKQKQANPWENIDQKYPVGSIVKGKIVNIVPYGAFFEIEKGVEGLIHISEMSWTRRINHPNEILSVGDEVEAMVLNIKKDEAKISLGIKQTEFNPWSVVEEKYPVGTRIRGRVRNITSYGAFVELEEGIDGLIHISDMSWTRKINHPTEVLKKGEITEAMVLAVDQEAKKITLGLKQLEENPWDTIDLEIQVGSVVEAEVTKIADFGVFATIENGIECLIHISQLSEKPFQRIEDIITKGDKVLAKVDRIDKQRRKIALSVKEHQREQRLAEQQAAMERAKAASLGEESIAGMKEHLEHAMGQLSPRSEPETIPAGAEAAETEAETLSPRQEQPSDVQPPPMGLEPEAAIGFSVEETPMARPPAEEAVPEPPHAEEPGEAVAPTEEKPAVEAPALGRPAPEEELTPPEPAWQLPLDEGPVETESPVQEFVEEVATPGPPSAQKETAVPERAPEVVFEEPAAPGPSTFEEGPAEAEAAPEEVSEEVVTPGPPMAQEEPAVPEPPSEILTEEPAVPEPPIIEERPAEEEAPPQEVMEELAAPESTTVQVEPMVPEPAPGTLFREPVMPQPSTVEEGAAEAEAAPEESSEEVVTSEPPTAEEDAWVSGLTLSEPSIAEEEPAEAELPRDESSEEPPEQEVADAGEESVMEQQAPEEPSPEGVGSEPPSTEPLPEWAPAEEGGEAPAGERSPDAGDIRGPEPERKEDAPGVAAAGPPTEREEEAKEGKDDITS